MSVETYRRIKIQEKRTIIDKYALQVIEKQKRIEELEAKDEKYKKTLKGLYKALGLVAEAEDEIKDESIEKIMKTITVVLDAASNHP